MIDILGLYNTLLTATLGGVPFSVIDTSQEVGRRTLRFLYPGIDAASYQDIGADDGPIMLRGILAGDDYIAQTRALRAVFRSPGPWNLVHPWLGNFQVVQVENQRPKITLSQTELRIARFEVAVYPFNPTAQPGLDTLSRLVEKAEALQADAQNWLASAMAPIAGVLGAFGYVQGFVSNVSGQVTSVLGLTPSGGDIAPACAPALAGLALPTIAPLPGWPAATAAALMAVPAAIGGAATPLVPSAVAPGGASVAAAAADPADVVTTLLAIVPGLSSSNMPSPGPALAAAFQAALVGAAVLAAAGIDYASQQVAEAQAAILYAALDAAAAAVATVAQSDPANAAPVWRDLSGLKAALAADLNALIGRLPEVVIINIPTSMSAWLLAQYVSGDEPGAVFATYQDICARNQVFHPAMVPAGPVEVLNQ
jgi:prophage DNA circulation protein